MNSNLQQLHPYPFQKLAKLKADCQPPSELEHINISIGEPKHPTPDFIVQALQQAATTQLPKYPTTQGSLELRQSISNWLTKRFQLNADSLDPNAHVLPINGTREALFAFAQAVIDREKPNPTVVMPNPFYQIYEGAALLGGAKPYFLNSLESTDFLPDFDVVPEQVWADCQLLYICSPNNPSGTVLSLERLQKLIQLADEYDFIIAADECYSELYADEDQPPVGLLQACASIGRNDYQRCVVFHSLSKRSNAPGLRSGFVAGDADILKMFLLYRTYHGCAMSLVTQAASTVAWQDETHVIENRRLYREKFTAVSDILSPILNVSIPPASFYLWQQTPIDDIAFAQQLFNQQHITVLPGQFLSRESQGINPGQNRIRIALVANLEQCVEAAQRIRSVVEHL
ncbi:succinyldiaminopimelate transaminase [Candidatus Albibeggiatoa sp. nov. NOAA]|uniref:succinyldiaminopimelate transaminase n=1 Tax=Candidatus Albibeggiatoa sp. nov. NOAA TaxID=3162724 RepID=UPI0032F1E024|nr:succinyldiaminopimelate transaminase [Thiotrichaceae bacterium]